MGKLLKKRQKGYAKKYMTRTKAIKKLQLSLKDFRRLCILKGIYPREPPKKISNKPTTFYLAKDITFLQSDKILKTFREISTHEKKMSKAYNRGQKERYQKLKDTMPQYSLRHLIKERYPTFIDALRDLDDCLSLINLFAVFPTHKSFGIPRDKIDACMRLMREFNLFVLKTNSLRKCFLSIKGIYYQAEIMGQTITWVTPYQFTQKLVHDVDYKVMVTFLEFYTTLMKFVNFKLYQSESLVYPPEKNQGFENSEFLSYQAMIAKVKTKNEEKELNQEKYKISEEFNSNQEVKEIKDKVKSTKLAAKLFENCVFFLFSEVPRYSLEFVILSFGGKVYWRNENFEYDESHEDITHVITDRDPKQLKILNNREYVQPQWIYDSINNQIKLPVGDYQPGKALPPHLSPFVDNKDQGYIPERQKFINKFKGIEEKIEEEDSSNSNDEEELNILNDKGKIQNKQENFDIEEELKKKVKNKKKMKNKIQELSKTIMKKKQRELYKKMMRPKMLKKMKTKKLKEKRDKIKQEKKNQK